MGRDINFGSDEADAKYQISDDGTPGNFVLARDTNGAVVLLEWNATTGAWEYGGPVDLDGNNLSDAGTTVYDASTDTVGDGTTSANHQSVNTDDHTINTSVTYPDGTTVTTSPGGIWSEESGSPYTALSANSINPSNLDTYQTYFIQADIVDAVGSSNNPTMQVGGDTGSNYTERTGDATKNTSQSEWGRMSSMAGNDAVTIPIILTKYKSSVAMTNVLGAPFGSTVIRGDNENVSWPPGQFTLKRGAGTDWTVRVWGRDA